MAKSKKKKTRRNVSRGVAHIKSTFNNTIVTITDTNGDTLCFASAGTVGFKGSRKSTPFAAQRAAEVAAEKGDQVRPARNRGPRQGARLRPRIGHHRPAIRRADRQGHRGRDAAAAQRLQAPQETPCVDDFGRPKPYDFGYGLRDMRVPCPKCGAPTEVLPYNLGRQIKCYECQSSLAVDSEGKVSLAVSGREPAPSRRSEPMADYGTGSTGGGGGGLAVVGNILFTIGTLVVITFLFLPLIDVVNLMSLRGPINMEVRKERRKLAEDRRDNKKDLKKVNDELSKMAFGKEDNTRRMELEKKRDSLNEKKQELDEKHNERFEAEARASTSASEDKYDEAEVSVIKRRPYYTMGMMAGFFFVAGGAICYLCLPGMRRRRCALGSAAVRLFGPHYRQRRLFGNNQFWIWPNLIEWPLAAFGQGQE